MHLTPSSLLEASIVLASMMAGNSMPTHGGADANAAQQFCQLYQSTCQQVCQGLGSQINFNECYLQASPVANGAAKSTLQDRCECLPTATLQHVDQEAEVYRRIGDPVHNGIFPANNHELHKRSHQASQGDVQKFCSAFTPACQAKCNGLSMTVSFNNCYTQEGFLRVDCVCKGNGDSRPVDYFEEVYGSIGVPYPAGIPRASDARL